MFVRPELEQSHNTGETVHVAFYHLGRNGCLQGTDPHRRRERRGTHGNRLRNSERDEREATPGDADDDSLRNDRLEPVCLTEGADVVHRTGSSGVLPRRQEATLIPHAGWLCATPPRPGGSLLASPASASSDGEDDPETTRGAIPRGDRNGAQSGSAAVTQIHPHGDARKAHGRGERTGVVYPGGKGNGES